MIIYFCLSTHKYDFLNKQSSITCGTHAMESLPREIISYIFSQTNSCHDVLNFRLVLKDFFKNGRAWTFIQFPFKWNRNISTYGQLETLAIWFHGYLDLSRTDVVDVSNLGNVRTLNLAGTKVVNVSALGNVHTLNLYGTRVVDVSALGNVHTLVNKNGRCVSSRQ